MRRKKFLWAERRGTVATLILAAIMTILAAAALAAGLAPPDQRYLLDKFGLASDSEVLKDLTADEQTKLHNLINDPLLKEYPFTRDDNVADFLFAAHMRECSVWASTHGEPACPPTADAQAEPGKEIADRQCNACHLFGTMDAPSFVALARAGKLSEQGLADALAHGHRMSPIRLESRQIAALLTYIRSLK